jgi:mRNA interferase MazF
VGNLNPNRGAEVGKIRPVLIIQARDKLLQTSQVVTDQPRTLDRKRLVEGPLTILRPDEMLALERSLSAA